MMVNKNLIAALIPASIFGAALVWLGIYYLHRYIHLRCLELDHWFHTLTPAKWRSPCQHCQGTGLGIDEDKDRNRSRSSRRQDRRRPSRARLQARDDPEWHAQEQLQRPRAVLRVQWPEDEHQQTPWFQGQNQADMHRGSAEYPSTAQVHPMAYPQAYPQTSHRTAHHVMQPTMSHWLESVPSIRTHQKRSRRIFEQSTAQSQSDASQPEQRPVRKEAPTVRKTDYIHIVDRLPPIVQEAIKKSAPAKPPSPTASSSTTSTESVEEVRRTYIPRALPRSASLGLGQSSDYPHFNTPVWIAPKSYARQ